jgi:small subunit ribosomal protein S13
MYLLGVNLPDAKRVSVALKSFYGIGRPRAEELCDRLLIHPGARLSELTAPQVATLAAALNGMTLEADARREVRARVQAMVDARTYRGLRHVRGFPVKGQRTRTNGSTASRLNGRGIKAAPGMAVPGAASRGQAAGFANRRRTLNTAAAAVTAPLAQHPTLPQPSVVGVGMRVLGLLCALRK